LTIKALYFECQINKNFRLFFGDFAHWDSFENNNTDAFARVIKPECN